MDTRKHFFFFIFIFFFFLFSDQYHLATPQTVLEICPDTELRITTSTTKKEARGTCSTINMTTSIQEQINGTRNICSEVLKSKWKKDVNKNKTKHVCPALIVRVQEKAFHQFVNVSDGELKGGFSIAVFCLALQELPYKILPVFVPTNEMGGSYNLLVQQIQDKTCEIVVGDVTITAERIKYADFTIPYMSSEIYMLVPAARKWNQAVATLIEPFTIRLWLTIICACIFTGIAIGILEYRANNREFRVPFYQILIMIVWFPVSAFFSQEGRIHNRNSKVVLVIWLTTMFIVVQIFTACLSSWLTVDQLGHKDYRVVGYQNMSCVLEEFVIKYMRSSSATVKLHPLKNITEYKKVLDEGTVDAIIEELPYIDIFIADFGHDYRKVGPFADQRGLGFALSRGSNLQQEFSRAIVNITASPDMREMKKHYFGIEIPIPTQPPDSSMRSLDVHGFLLVFVFLGGATVFTIICSEISLMRTPARISPEIPTHLIMSPLQTVSANPNRIAENEHMLLYV